VRGSAPQAVRAAALAERRRASRCFFRRMRSCFQRTVDLEPLAMGSRAYSYRDPLLAAGGQGGEPERNPARGSGLVEKPEGRVDEADVAGRGKVVDTAQDERSGVGEELR
jgi:hypothetical protein